MRWGKREIVLFVGLCCVGLGGCASLRLSGDSDNFDAPATLGTTVASGIQAPLSQASTLLSELGVPIHSDQEEKNTLEGQFALARLCERRHENKEAGELYLILLEMAPDDVRLHHRLGVLAVKMGDFPKAEEYFGTAQSLVPASAELLSDVGYCYYLQHQFTEAEAKFNEALKLESTHAAAINNLALVLGRQGRVEESLNLFKRTNSEAEAYANLAYVLAQNGDRAQAEQLYLHALTLDNKMRVAAEAVLQLKEREQIESRLKPESVGPLAAATPTSVSDGMSEQLVRLPKTEL